VERQRAAVVTSTLVRGAPARAWPRRGQGEGTARSWSGACPSAARRQASSARWPTASATRAGKQGREGEERE